MINKLLSDTISASSWTRVGKATTKAPDGSDLRVGDVWECNGLMQMSLVLKPVSGIVNISFGSNFDRGERDLTALVFGKHDAYEYKIGEVEVNGSSGVARVIAWPNGANDDYAMYF